MIHQYERNLEELQQTRASTTSSIKRLEEQEDGTIGGRRLFSRRSLL